MSIKLSVDRLEGDGKTLAVLLSDQGDTGHIPLAWLPKGTKPGDVLTFAIKKDAATTKAVADETARVQNELTRDDDGGDVTL